MSGIGTAECSKKDAFCYRIGREIARGREHLPLLKLRTAQNAFGAQGMFHQQTWVYWVLGVILFLVARIGIFFAIYFALMGSRYIVSRANLVAICDFILQTPELSKEIR